MNKWMWAGGLVLVAGFSAPWAVGIVTEQQWQRAASEMNASQPYFELDTSTYNRRFFSADVEGSLRIRDPKTGEVHRIPYRGDVSHGMTGSEVDFQPWEEGEAGAINELFPGEKPRLTVSVRPWGAVDVELSIPAINLVSEETGETLEVAESSGSARIDRSGDGFQLDLHWPGMTASGPDSSLTVEDFRVSQEMERLEGDVWVGEGSVSLSGIKGNLPDQPDFLVSGLQFSTSTDPEEDGRRFSVRSRFGVESLVNNGEQSGPYGVELALSGIDVAAWNRLMTAIAELRALNSIDTAKLSREAVMEQQMGRMAAVSDAVKQLAGAGFSIGIPDLSLNTPEGLAKGEMLLRHPELTEDERATMGLVMERLTGDLNLALPVALAEAEPEIMARLQPLIDQGMITREAGQYRLDAHLEDLSIDINGNQIPLPPMI